MATEKRLIDANELPYYPVSNFSMVVFKDDIENAPTVDAVEVVRCEKCQYWNPRYETIGMCMKHNSIVTFTKPDFYCAWGKGKNNGICKEN